MRQDMIGMIASVSPSARRYISDEQYLQLDEDTVTVEVIVGDLYYEMLKDFRDMGITFDCQIEELFESDVNGEKICLLMKYVSFDWLSTYLSGHRNLVTTISGLIADDELDNKVFTFYQQLSAEINDETLNEALDLVEYWIINDLDFDIYLNRVLTSLPDEDVNEVVNPEETHKLMIALDNTREFLKQFIKSNMAVYHELIDAKLITRVIENYGRDILSPDMINTASAFFSANPERRKSTLFKDMIFKYRTQSRLYLEGYVPTASAVYRTATFTDTEMVLIVIGENFDVLGAIPARRYTELLKEVNKCFAYTPSEKTERLLALIEKGVVPK